MRKKEGKEENAALSNTQEVKNGIDFQVFYRKRNFRICTTSRIVDHRDSTILFVHVDPHESLGIEMVAKGDRASKGKKYYLVLSFVRLDSNGKIWVEEVDGRVASLHFINKGRYKKTLKKAISLMERLKNGEAIEKK